MLRLFLIRHGQTAYNVANIVQGGGVDSDLNDHGRLQAEHFYNAWNHVSFDNVVCSALKRTHQTVEPFLKPSQLPILLPELNEFNWGVIEGKEATAEVRAEFDRLNDLWRNGHTHLSIEGGESPEVAAVRLHTGIRRIQELHPRGGNVLVCTHGRVMRILLSTMLGYGLPLMNHFPHENTALNIIRLYPGGKVLAERLNDVRHLKPLLNVPA